MARSQYRPRASATRSRSAAGSSSMPRRQSGSGAEPYAARMSLTTLPGGVCGPAATAPPAVAGAGRDEVRDLFPLADQAPEQDVIDARMGAHPGRPGAVRRRCPPGVHRPQAVDRLMQRRDREARVSEVPDAELKPEHFSAPLHLCPPHAFAGRARRVNTKPRISAALRHRDFALLWGGQTISLVGNGMYTVTLHSRCYGSTEAPGPGVRRQRADRTDGALAPGGGHHRRSPASPPGHAGFRYLLRDTGGRRRRYSSRSAGFTSGNSPSSGPASASPARSSGPLPPPSCLTSCRRKRSCQRARCRRSASPSVNICSAR